MLFVPFIKNSIFLYDVIPFTMAARLCKCAL